MLTIPTDIEVAKFAGAPIKFRQSEDLLSDAMMRSDPKVAGWSRACTNQAQLALSAALVEWIAWRLQGPWEVGILHQFAESLWAAQINPLYPKDLHPPRPKKKDIASHYIWNVWNTGNAQRRIVAKGEAKHAKNVMLASIARAVAPKKKDISNWIMDALKRLYELYPVEKALRDKRSECNGSSVPREALDLSTQFDPEKTAEYLEALRKNLDPATNPFLASAEEMKTAGFEGEPY